MRDAFQKGSTATGAFLELHCRVKRASAGTRSLGWSYQTESLDTIGTAISAGKSFEIELFHMLPEGSDCYVNGLDLGEQRVTFMIQMLHGQE